MTLLKKLYVLLGKKNTKIASKMNEGGYSNNTEIHP
jgi:hypothetical protein